jgi:hypothetical protein
VPSLYNTLSSTQSIKLNTCRICDTAGVSRAYVTLRLWPRVLQLPELVGMSCQRLATTVLLRRDEGYVRLSRFFALFRIHVFGSFSKCKTFEEVTRGVRLLSVITFLIRGCWILMLSFEQWCVVTALSKH